MKLKLTLTDKQGCLLDELDFEVGGRDGYNLDKPMARQTLSQEIIDMIARAALRAD